MNFELRAPYLLVQYQFKSRLILPERAECCWLFLPWSFLSDWCPLGQARRSNRDMLLQPGKIQKKDPERWRNCPPNFWSNKSISSRFVLFQLFRAKTAWIKYPLNRRTNVHGVWIILYFKRHLLAILEFTCSRM